MDCLSVGVDLGQASDPTAIAVTAVVGAERHVRHLERVPLGTKYPIVVERVRTLVTALPSCGLIVDGTGVGRAVVDMLEAAGMSPLVVYITSGKQIRREGQRVWLPKAKLIGPLISELDAGTLKIAASLPDAPVLLHELHRFKVTRGTRGHSKFEGDGAHDDLIIAVALSLFGQTGAGQTHGHFNIHSSMANARG